MNEEEAKRYDRQLRLWGLEAQNKLSSSRVLFSSLDGLQAEIIKNIVLTGVGTVTLNDWEVVQARDLSSLFFAEEGEVGKNRAEVCQPRVQELNPLVEVKVDTSDIRNKGKDYFRSFDVVCVSGWELSALMRLDGCCRELGVKLLAVDTFGFYGCTFLDLGEHSYRIEKTDKVRKDDTKKRKVVTDHTSSYPSLHDTIQAKGVKAVGRVHKAYVAWRILKKFEWQYNRKPNSGDEDKVQEIKASMIHEDLQIEGAPKRKLAALNDEFVSEICRTAQAKLSPVCSIVGGITAGDIIKAISGRDPPTHNVFCFYMMEGPGAVESIATVK